MSVSVLGFSLYIIGYCLTLVFLGYKSSKPYHRLHYFSLRFILLISLFWPFCLVMLIWHHFMARANRKPAG